MKKTKEMERAEIMFLDKMLPDIGEDAKKFLADPFDFSVCNKRYGKRAEKKGLYWCSDCGESFTLSEISDYRPNPKCISDDKYTFHYRKHIGTCPHCGKRMEIEDYVAKSHTFKDVCAINATMGEWAITRYFALRCHYKPDHKPEILIADIGAEWTKDGQTRHQYLAMRSGMGYSRWWREGTRHFADYLGCDGDVYEWSGEERYDMPDFSLERELERRGIEQGKLHGVKLTRLIQYMNDDPHFETLWKQGDWETALFFKSALPRYWAQLRIARRHGYTIENLTEWRDLIDMMRYADGYDVLNPTFICPADLHAMHNQVAGERERREQARRDRIRRENDELDRERARVAMMNRAEQNEDYIKRRGKYFGLGIVTDKFTIVALKSIDEFENEGNTLHHCVFRAGYYLRSHSLILSARDAENNPIETLEIDLRSYTIVQCYGPHDTYTDMHDEIVNAMKNNMWQVKEIAKGKMSVAS